ncbi:uncharacterized protein LOC117119164 [Anneissia japonica]|uniref:uncharacterized protein LOC117119164 n=1 Tax=Anneissia japonica TaxID=1529436 RepID=UPI001425930C|nr:uncharacterized protein LOC117119164 [Anneissia japonica]
MKVHIFGAASSPGIANYALNRAADVYENKYGSDAADIVKYHFYVDDELISVSRVEEGVNLAKQTIELCKDAGSDAFQFSSCVRERHSTRRGVLSMVSSIFYPLGFVSPYVLNAKKTLQHLCTNRSDWDQPFPTSVEQK